MFSCLCISVFGRRLPHARPCHDVFAAPVVSFLAVVGAGVVGMAGAMAAVAVSGVVFAAVVVHCCLAGILIADKLVIFVVVALRANLCIVSIVCFASGAVFVVVSGAVVVAVAVCCCADIYGYRNVRCSSPIDTSLVVEVGIFVSFVFPLFVICDVAPLLPMQPAGSGGVVVVVVSVALVAGAVVCRCSQLVFCRLRCFFARCPRRRPSRCCCCRRCRKCLC